MTLFRVLIRTILPWEGVRSDLRTLRSDTFIFAQNIYSRVFYGRKLRTVKGKHLLLNFGAGKLEGAGKWINVDLQVSPGVFWADLREPLSLPDACAERIHCEHFLEHLEYFSAKRLLSECYRILEPRGSLRVVVPDAAKYITAYCRNDREFFEKLNHLGGTIDPLHTRMEIINQSFRMGGAHRFSWDFETLEFFLREAGFSEIKQSGFDRAEASYNIDGKDDWRVWESLYVEAVKS